uniref:AT-rich interactive domain-containing protein 1B-like n=1 Tax=Haemonchus placei TaxID=6290 RepID=A0A0N4W863_HAEPC
MSPGWNDPPNLGTPSPGSGSSRLAHLRKRLVDPSISGGSSNPGSIMSQPGHGPPAHMYAGNTNRMGHQQSQSVCSAPSPAAANSQSSIANHAQPYQQNIGMHNQSPAVISPSNIPQSNAVQMHLPQQPDQGYSSSATYSYSETVPPANQQNQAGHQFTSVSGPGSNPQNGDGSNSQFFHQQQYHEAPPIRR